MTNITVKIADIFYMGTQHRFSNFFNDDCKLSNSRYRDEYSNKGPQAKPI